MLRAGLVKMQLEWMDVAIAAIVGLSIIMGVIRGFIKELVALCIWALAISCAYAYNGQFDSLLSAYVHDPMIKKVIGFVVILLLIVFAGGLLNTFFGYAIRRSGLSSTDRLLGIGFGFLRGVLIVSFVMLVVKMTGFPYDAYTKNSKLYAHFEPIVHWLSGFTPEMIGQIKGLDKSKQLSETYETPEQGQHASIMKPLAYAGKRTI